jgi:DNA-binding winged helix-turn-helix (wHTH) protein/TolB-like protein/Tfp pilus assembly protein PilF
MLYQFNNYEIDTENFTLKHNEVKVDVEPRVFDLIHYLIVHKNRLVTRDELFQNIWDGRNVLDATLSNHIKNARGALGDNGQAQKVIKTIHGRGYQFVAEINHQAKEVITAVASTTHNKQKSYGLFAVLFLIPVLLLSIYLLTIKPNDTTPKIAVLPFNNTQPNPESDYFGFALADQIIGDLSYLKNISVRPSASIRKYSKLNTDPIAIGKEMEVDYILNGNYAKVGNAFRLNIELVDIKTGDLIWRSRQIETDAQNSFELQDIVAKKVIDVLKVKFSSSEIRRIQYDISTNPLAYEYYLRSVAYPYTSSGNKLAIEMLKKSIALDANYALSYVQLGDRVRRFKQFSLQDLPYQTAEEYYNKALQLNPELLSALSYLSMFYTETNRIESAIALVKKMIEINPSNANTHFTLGYIYRYTGMVDAAIEEMENAVKLDPYNPKFRSLIGTYSGAKMYHKALNQVKLYKESPFTLGWNGLLQRRLGNTQEALAYFNQVIEVDQGGLWANVAIVFKSYIQGNNTIGIAAVQKLAQTADSDGETLYYLSSYYGLLGDTKNCIITLKKAIDAGFYNYPFMVSNDYFDSVKNEKEFIELLEKAQTKHLDFKETYF